MIHVKTAPAEPGGKQLEWYKPDLSGAGNDCPILATDGTHTYVGSTENDSVAKLTQREFETLKKSFSGGDYSDL